MLQNAVSKRAFAKCKALFVCAVTVSHCLKIVIPSRFYEESAFRFFVVHRASEQQIPRQKAARDDSVFVMARKGSLA
jgi:hypothetical protein